MNISRKLLTYSHSAESIAQDGGSDSRLNAIESEFRQASVTDEVRLQQLFCHSAVDGHILRKFSWGNKRSLDTVPKEKGVDMAQMLGYFGKLIINCQT